MIGILGGAAVLQVAALTWVILRQEKISSDLHQLRGQIVENQNTPLIPSSSPAPVQSNVTISPIATVSTNPTAMSTISATLTTLRSQIDTLQSTVTALQKAGSIKKTSPEVVGSTEAVLFMGSGSTTNRDWVTLPSTTLTITPQNFGTLRDVRFEAGLSIEGGIAQARLIDATTGSIFYDSALQHDRNATLWQTSPSLNISLQTGTYAVQLRSSSGELAKLDGARIRLYLKK